MSPKGTTKSGQRLLEVLRERRVPPSGGRILDEQVVRVLLALRSESPVNLLAEPLCLAQVETHFVADFASLSAWCEKQEAFMAEVVFLDSGLPGCDVEESLPELCNALAPAPIVVLGQQIDTSTAARLLSLGVPSLVEPVSADALGAIARRLRSRTGRTLSGVTRVAVPALSQHRDLEVGAEHARAISGFLNAYVTKRALSERQTEIFMSYLRGMNDKEIAVTCACSEATVYEHWRRMAQKVGAHSKADVVGDFHRFLVGGIPSQ